MCLFHVVVVWSLSFVRLFASVWLRACQAPLPMEIPRQEPWEGLPFPTPRGLPDPGIEPAASALAGRFFTTKPPWKPHIYFILWLIIPS